VPAGLPHAIDPGLFLVELQEPTDFSVLLEWEGFAADGAETVVLTKHGRLLGGGVTVELLA
jgi:hypothetical protein